METSEQRETRIRSMHEEAARSLVVDIGNAAFDILETICPPEEWMGKHDQDVTITMSQADWARVFTALQFMGQQEYAGEPKASLDFVYLAMTVATEMAAVAVPLTAA